MRLLHRDKHNKLHLTEFFSTDMPAYAILSHTWGPRGEDVTFKDIADGQAEHKTVGFKKIDFCAKQATKHGFHYFWVESCCIDKSSCAELTEAINSMFRWYKNAAKCYGFLTDVSTPDANTNNAMAGNDWMFYFRKSRWFTREWTLQELIAPTSVEFFSIEEKWLGNKHTLEGKLQAITGIDIEALRGKDLSTFSIEDRMGWASKRNTTREEDQAYCLLGIFDISMASIYSEGKRALRRLEKKIKKSLDLEQPFQYQRINTIHHGFSGMNLGTPKGPQEELLLSLHYPEYAARCENVKPSWENTFQWIFQEDDVEPKRWSNFNKWLRDSSSVYWISGKAGSGKSTLMSYILHEPQLKDNLNIWNHGRDVSILSFFFWRAGSDLQKSVIGMLRSLLYQLLEDVPQISLTLMTRARLNVGRLPSWTEQNLATLLTTAFGICADQKFCLMIDGLDEFEGNTDELLDLILELDALPNVKCCLSSWPETALLARLSTFSQLQLQDLNHSDIERFVDDKLATCSQSYGQSTERSDLANIIVSRAEGVFLWAAIVTGSAIQGIRAGDSNDMIKRRIETIPSQMESLFTQMLTSIEPIHRESLLIYVEILRSRRHEGDATPTSLALITASMISKDLVNYRNFAAECQRVEKQIHAQSKGLLEVSKVAPLCDQEVPPWFWSIPQGNSGEKIGPTAVSTPNSRIAIAM